MDYMVDARGPKPDLVRNNDGVFERYDPRVPGKWKGSKFLDAFGWGGGDFVWYDDVSWSEAERYMAEIDAFWKGKEENGDGKDDSCG